MSKKKRSKEQEQESAGGSESAEEQGREQTPDLQAERDELFSRLQRVSADYLNYQKRVGREKADAHNQAIADLIKALLPAIDDMERALDAARENHGEDDPFFKGMQLVHDKTMEALGKFGCTVIQAVGEPFDPDKHAAMMQQPADEHQPQTVIQELQKGYSLHGRTLRPSGVIVAVALEEGQAGPEEVDEEETGEKG